LLVDEGLEVVAPVGRRVPVVGEDVLEVLAGGVHLFGLKPQGLDALLDDLRPASSGGRAGQNLADLVQAHLPHALPVPDDGQPSDVGGRVPATPGPPG
jgi:hypothetical protein